MPESIPEKLQVFVSSTIQECAAERKIAKRAIESLNHQPILFEHVGARSTPPRQLYLSKLDQSDIFVGIYKNSYGWVAPGATISGIDEELRRSGQRGMPRLVYVLQPGQDRDARLKTMFDGLQMDVTFWHFRNPEELYDRIREDVEAEVTRRFQKAERLEAIVRADPAEAISGLIPAPSHLLRRRRLSEDLLDQVSRHHVLQVSGELGIGKTVFLASVAAESRFLFVSGTQLSNHELACVLANKLISVAGGQARYFLDAPSAYSALIESWRTAESFTLVIDDCPDPEFVAALLRNVGGGSGTKRLIYSMRNADASYGHVGFPVPPLSLVEVGELLSSYGQRLSGKAQEEIYQRSGGNPLYLLYFSQSPDTNTEKSLVEYELDAWRKLTPVARELVSYLGIANERLLLEDLVVLAGRGARIEEVSDALKTAQVFVAEFPNGYASRHEHQRQTVLAQLEASPNRLAYYSRRVAHMLKGRGDYARAYLVLRATDRIAARRISRSALFDAMRQGDFTSQLLVLEDILETAPRPGTDAHDRMLLLLSKAQALQYTGQGSRIDDVLTEADRLAASCGDAELKLQAREARSAYAAATSLTAESVESLRQLELEYLALGDRWSAGRLASELSALFIRAKRFHEALESSERALKIFEELGDDYGISVAMRNRASALTGIPGRESEAIALMERLREHQEKAGTERERAWLCNYMVRTLRRKKQFEEALRYGREAVEIGEKLGDLYVVGTNRVCVGNVYRDMDQLGAALAEYSAAGDVAQRLRDRSLESSACRLAAGIYRRQGNNRVALEHAQLSVSLIEGTFASELADALEEVGDCQRESRNWAEAAESYAKAAAASTDIEEKSRLTVEALSTCLDEGLSPMQYLGCLELAYAPRAKRDGPVTEQLFHWMGDLLGSMHVDYALRLFGLHLRLMFVGLPQPVSRFLFKKVRSEMAAQTKGADAWRLLFPAMPLTAGISEWHLSLLDIVELGDLIQDRIAGLHFKPQGDGALWVVALNLQQPVILTITCLDARVETLTAATLLALFFKGFERSVAEILAVPQIPRQELDIHVCNIESMPSDMRPYFPSDFTTCAVTRPTQPAQQEGGYVPTFVVCHGDIGRQWRAGTGSASAVQRLLGETLVEVAYQLLKGEVDMDVLKPKIVEIVRKTVS